MISMVQPILAGNALRLFFEPPADAVQWKVLRKASDTLPDTVDGDPSAALVYDGNERVVMDTLALVNDQMAFYRPFYTSDGVTWTPGPTASGTPAATYEEVTTDVLAFLRERLEAGLKVEVDRQNLVHDLGYIPCINGSPSLERDLQFPLVTVHLESEDPTTRALGEDIAGDLYDQVAGMWEESEGWLAHVRVTAIGWCLNADARIELRKAIRRVILANLAVFDARGWIQIELSQQDVDAVSGEYHAPVFQVMNNFTCVAPSIVKHTVAPISEVDTTVIGERVNPNT